VLLVDQPRDDPVVVFGLGLAALRRRLQLLNFSAGGVEILAQRA